MGMMELGALMGRRPKVDVPPSSSSVIFVRHLHPSSSSSSSSSSLIGRPASARACSRVAQEPRPVLDARIVLERPERLAPAEDVLVPAGDLDPLELGGGLEFLDQVLGRHAPIEQAD